MVRADDYFKKEGLEKDAHLLLQVHDELVYEIRESKCKEIAATVKEIMESVLSEKETKGVPIVAEAAHGPNWGEMKKL